MIGFDDLMRLETFLRWGGDFVVFNGGMVLFMKSGEFYMFMLSGGKEVEGDIEEGESDGRLGDGVDE